MIEKKKKKKEKMWSSRKNNYLKGTKYIISYEKFRSCYFNESKGNLKSDRT